MSLIKEDGGRRVSMAHVAVVGSHAVNGVAANHTDLMKSTIFRDFSEFYPDKISNKTTGITPRRWLCLATPALSSLIGSRIGPDRPKDHGQLQRHVPHAGAAGIR